MRKEDCFYLGTITRRHGLKGNLLIKMDTDQPEAYQKLESILVEFNRELVPFFLQSSKIYKDDILNILPETINQEQIDQLKGRDVYLPLTLLPPLSGKQFYYHEVEGFEIQKPDGTSAGIIQRVNDRVPQPYFISKLQDTEINIPVVKDWIIEVNREEKKLIIDFPEGLLEVFLEK